MIASAKTQHLRMSPKKVRLVLALIRGKDVVSSLAALEFVPKRAALPVSKLLHSALSNAKQKGLSENQLVVSKVTANDGPRWKRFKAGPFGRAMPILKRTTHLTIELDLKTK